MKLVEKDGAILLAVKVVPNSSRTGVARWLGEALKVKVTQPAEGGKANKAVIALLGEVFGVAASQIQIVSGSTQPRKVVQITGITAHDVLSKITVVEQS